MKKLFLLLASMSAFMLSCSSENDPAGGDSSEKGAIVLRPAVNFDMQTVSTRQTPTDDLSTWFVTLEGPGGTTTIPYPDNDIVTNLQPGEYLVTVHSHNTADFMPANPAWDEQAYKGTTESPVTVSAGSNATATLTCRQVNAGVYFEYHSSLVGTELEGIVPSVTQGGEALVYEGESREEKGYFKPGTVTVTATVDDVAVQLGGQLSRTLTLAAEQLWKITLSAEEITTGGIILSVTVQETLGPNNTDTWTIEGGAEENPEVEETFNHFNSASCEIMYKRNEDVVAYIPLVLPVSLLSTLGETDEEIMAAMLALASIKSLPVLNVDAKMQWGIKKDPGTEIAILTLAMGDVNYALNKTTKTTPPMNSAAPAPGISIVIGELTPTSAVIDITALEGTYLFQHVVLPGAFKAYLEMPEMYDMLMTDLLKNGNLGIFEAKDFRYSFANTTVKPGDEVILVATAFNENGLQGQSSGFITESFTLPATRGAFDCPAYEPEAKMVYEMPCEAMIVEALKAKK